MKKLISDANPYSSQFRAKQEGKSAKENFKDDDDDYDKAKHSKYDHNSLIILQNAQSAREIYLTHNNLVSQQQYQGYQYDSSSKQITSIAQNTISRRSSRDLINPLQAGGEGGNQLLFLCNQKEDETLKSVEATQRILQEKESYNKVMQSQNHDTEDVLFKEGKGDIKLKESKEETRQIEISIEQSQPQDKNKQMISKRGSFSYNEENQEVKSNHSNHFEQMLQEKDKIKKEKERVLLLFFISIAIEVCQQLRRGLLMSKESIFVILSASSILAQIITLGLFFQYLNKLQEKANNNQILRILFIVLSQIMRVVAFLNVIFLSSPSCNTKQNLISVSGLETMIEAYMIFQMTEQVLRNFKVFKVKEISLINFMLLIIASILLIDTSLDSFYLLIIQTGFFIIYLIFRLFLLKEFPSQIDAHYYSNNKNKQQKEKQKKPDSVLNTINPQTPQVHSKRNNLQKLNNSSFSPILRNKIKEEAKDSKMLQKNLLFKAKYSVLVNEYLHPICYSKKMKSLLKNAKPNNSQLPHKYEEFNGDMKAKSNSQFFKFLENIIIERLDVDSMKSWETLKISKSNMLQPTFHQMNSKKPSFFLPQLSEYNSELGCNALNKGSYQESIGVQQQYPTLASPNCLPTYLNITTPQSILTYKDMVQVRNSNANIGKPTISGINQNVMGYCSKIGLKSKNVMVNFKDFLLAIIQNQHIFEKYNLNKPIIVASYSTDDSSMTQDGVIQFQINIYPNWCKKQKIQSASEITHSINSMINIDAQQEAALLNKSSNFLIVLEEVQERERIVGKTQFYKLLKSIFRCFNNDLTRSLGNILGTSQAGLANKDISDKLKEKLVRPILLSCKLIKYILHNLRDFNDLVGERFKLQVSETSIPKVAEDSVILFRATSDKKISFKVVINEEVPIVILTDQRRLVQIIITLLSNANKHTTAGSLTFRIFHPKVGDIFLRSHLRFQVEDTGEGMESSIQARLSKLFNSGISYQDFKQISTFGFNLFICNILAKKLFYPENKDQQDPLILDDSDASGIKFTSKPGFGSIFYFDIRLFEEKKPERLQDSIFNYLVVSQAQSAHQKPRREDFTSFKGNQNLIRSNIFISNSIPSLNHQAQLSKSQADRFLNDHQQEKEDNQQNKKYNRFNDNTDQSRSKFKPAIKPGDTFKEEENAMEIPEEEDDIDGREKQETRTMVFQSRPQGMHSDYKYLRCECKNVLIIDRVQTSLDTFDMVLQTFHFHPQKCRSLQEAIATAQHKYQNSCSICNQRMFICIFISIDEFLKQDVLQTFPTELESFMYSSACSDSVIIIISSSDTPAKKLNDNQRIDDFLSSTFDSIELQNLISKWKLLPPQDYFTQTNNQIQSHVIPLSPS